jgi:NADH dehydrogenase FAD-containing subunit
MFQENKKQSLHHVVIIGGGFGGLYAAQSLAKAPVKVTLIDKRNFHVFQPLLYQVATGGLSPSNISSPLRALLKRNKNTEVLMGEVTDIEPDCQVVKLNYREISYDSLIVATGATPQYFGNSEWAKKAPGLKTVEDALEIRRRVFLAFESAEKEIIPEKRQDWLTFVLVGGGAAGVELAGALAELTRSTLKEDFRNIDPATAKIILIQSPDRILPTYPAELSTKALNKLKSLEVQVKTNTKVSRSKNHFWASDRDGNLLPAVAPAAMQAGQYVARLITNRLQGKDNAPFRYFDWGNLAVIGKHAAVIDFGFIKLSGILAWLIWMFIHVFYLLEFDNKLIVAIQYSNSLIHLERGISTDFSRTEINSQGMSFTAIFN